MRFKFFKIPVDKKVSIQARETWVVRWRSRFGAYHSDTKDECEIFVSEKTACEFAKKTVDTQ